MDCAHLDPLGADLFMIFSCSENESSLDLMLVIDDVSMLIMWLCGTFGSARHISSFA
jgi:hypothetical protein